MKNFYTVLEINESAQSEEIKKAYRSLAKRYHPDVNNGNDTRFREIAEAYKILSDPVSRHDYDMALRNFQSQTSSFDSYLDNMEFNVGGKNLQKMVSELVKQANLTKIKIKYEGRTLVEIPLAAASILQGIGFVLSPITALLINIGINRIFTIEITNKAMDSYVMGIKFHEDGRLSEAEKLYKEAVATSEYFLPAYINLGMIYRQRGENQKAIENFRKVLEITPFGELAKIAKENLEAMRGF